MLKLPFPGRVRWSVNCCDVLLSATTFCGCNDYLIGSLLKGRGGAKAQFTHLMGTKH